MLQHARRRPGRGDRARRAVLRPTGFLRKTRGWSDEEYDAATERLRERGWLDADGDFTDLGRDERQRIEDDTDRLAVEGWTRVGVERTARLHELVKPLRETVLAADVLPRTIRP